MPSLQPQQHPPLLLAALTSAQGPMAAAAAQVLLALLGNCCQGGGEYVLERAGLLPHRLRKNRELMAALTGSCSGVSLEGVRG